MPVEVTAYTKRPSAPASRRCTAFQAARESTLCFMVERLASCRLRGYPIRAVKPARLLACVMPISSLVSVTWLAERLTSPRVRVLDASWYLAAAGRDPAREFAEGHIPGAQLFRIDDASDPASPLPHTFPAPDLFAGYVSRLGISSGDHVVVYDASGTNFSAARAWWMFRVFGHDAVSVLDGGLAAWKAGGRALERGDPVTPSRGVFVATVRSGLLRTAPQVLASIQGGSAQVVDMRSRGRFEGTEPEPRAGLRSGHIPGSRNVPYATLVDEHGLVRTSPALRRALSLAGIDLERPVIATCGSGVTACTLLLALDVLGVTDAALYDGSWSEWGQRTELPVETGPPA
jgi:thiosulfate/3-mercaptopyruvate sulfurtransferase